MDTRNIKYSNETKLGRAHQTITQHKCCLLDDHFDIHINGYHINVYLQNSLHIDYRLRNENTCEFMLYRHPYYM